MMRTADVRGDAPPSALMLRRREVSALALMPWLAGGARARDGMTLGDKLGPLYGPGSRHGQPPRFSRRHWNDAASPIARWNEVAIDASGIDHTPVAVGETRVFGEQLGPCRASRAMAIVHIAIADAVAAVEGGFVPLTALTPAPDGTALGCAVAQAAHCTLAALYPSQAAGLDALLAEDLARRRHASADALAAGVELGRSAAAAVLALRQGDGAAHAEPRIGVDYTPGTLPGQWRQDPVSRIPLAMGARWASVRPFVLASAQALRVPPPPVLTSDEYSAAFDEIKRLGGDNIATPTVRSAEQTFIGIYWAYDGTPSLCAPPRLYNQVAMQIARQRGTPAAALARLLALANIAMADAAIAAWESKYHYNVWRPVTGVREAGGDGNDSTVADTAFTPLGAPASNLTGPNFTPPFPSYPSGHAVFGGALFQTLRRFYGTDRIAFKFVSDEFNGETLDNQGQVRLLAPRSFMSLSQAEEENGRSRIYLGIHWDFDCTQGIAQGQRVADAVFVQAYNPRSRRS